MGHLATLGLERGASGTAIHAAYKALAFENHPDRAQGSRKDAAKVRLSDINQAYAWLVSHPEETAA
ncbi:MAG: DnaJ domain-containing protein [bacterium]|nr:DnaJ domain-containing protein [bacterium]